MRIQTVRILDCRSNTFNSYIPCLCAAGIQLFHTLLNVWMEIWQQLLSRRSSSWLDYFKSWTANCNSSWKEFHIFLSPFSYWITYRNTSLILCFHLNIFALWNISEFHLQKDSINHDSIASAIPIPILRLFIATFHTAYWWLEMTMKRLYGFSHLLT